jgi:molecular chaperone GrpE
MRDPKAKIKQKRKLRYKLKRSRYVLKAHARPSLPDTQDQDLVIENLKQIHEREMKNFQDRLLRAHADLDNFRKRSVRERQELVKFANESLISYLLPVLDNFSHALGADQNSEDVESYRKGVELIYQQMLKVFTESGLEKIEAMNKPFDPSFHEAMATEYDANAPENHVLQVLRDGYMLRGRLLRPALVRVNKKPETDTTPRQILIPNPEILPEPLEQHKEKKEKTSRKKS